MSGEPSAQAPGPVGKDPLGALERAAVAEEALSVVRHDLRNKLGIIRNAAFYIKRCAQQTDLGERDPRAIQFFKVIEDEISAAVGLLDLGNAVKHVFARRVGRTRVEAAVRHAMDCARIAPEERAQLTVEASPEHVDADPNELALAIRCLLENALEASPEGARVAVRVGPEAERVAIEVHDLGAGIAADIEEKVVDPFFTTKEGHAGLGINVARRIARRYGGELALRSTAAGFTAVLLLPHAKEPAP